MNSKSKRRGAVGNIEPQTVITIALVVAGVIGFDLVSKLLTGLGIWQSNDSKSLDSQTKTANSPWNPNYYTQFSNYTYAIDTPTATTLSNKIYDSFGIFNDCEDCVKAVFFALRTQSEVSFLVKVFNDVYGQDLLSYLRGGLWPQDHLSDADVQQINKFVLSLPTN